MDKSLDHSPASTIAQKSTLNQSNTDLMNPNLEKVLDIEEPTDVAKSHDPEAVPSPLAPLIPGPPPDGGLQAWLAVLGGFCTIFASFGWINCIGIFQEYYQSHQLRSYSPSTVAWIPSTESFMMFFCGPISGFLADAHGPRFPILLGSFLHVFGLMMTSLSSQYYQFFLAQSIVSALGCSFLFFPTITAVGSFFAKHRALALGIIVSGSSIGGVILPILVTHLIPRVGFGWAMRVVAFLLLFLLIIGNMTITTRLPPSKKKFSVKEFILPFREKAFVLLTASSWFIYFGGFLPFTFIVASARTEGMNAALASYLVAIVNGASTFGRILPAHLSDTHGVFNIFILTTLLCAISVLAIWLPAHSNAPLIAFAAVYGFASGCTFSIVPAMVANITTDMSKLGTRVGALYAVSAVGALIGSPVAGQIIRGMDGGYGGLIGFSGASLLVGVGLAMGARTAIVGSKVWVKV